MKIDRTALPPVGQAGRDERLARSFAAVERRLQSVQAMCLGHPYGQSLHPAVPGTLLGHAVHPPADSDTGAAPLRELAEMEHEAMAWLMRLWGCHDLNRFCGAFAASGSEGNLWGIHLGRERLRDAVLLYGADAHPSLPDAARILQVPARQVASLPNGEMDMADLAAQVQALAGKAVIVGLTCGTTMKGAHDAIASALSVLRDAGYDQDNRHVHVDGALNAMVLPFLQDAPLAIQPSFEQDIDSLSTCGHTMIGTPMPCAVVVARKAPIGRAATRAQAHPHLLGTDAMRSRNSHAALAIWARLIGQGYGRMADDAQRCVQRAARLARDLSALGAPVLCNPFALTVVFPQPADRLVRRYQLPCRNGQARAIVMPSVPEALLAQFLVDFSDWWAGRHRLP